MDPAAIEALTVEADIPYGPATRGGPKGYDKWAALFGKLTANGQSIAFPAEWHTAVASRAQKLRKTTQGHAWYVRKVSDSHSRLWRVGQ